MSPAASKDSSAQLREALSTCLAVPRWVDEVASRAPYGSLLELLDVAAGAAHPLTAAEIEGAVAHHPRIGERPTGADQAAALSRAEQQSSASEDEGWPARWPRATRRTRRSSAGCS